jgi:hypothetical protein
MFKILLALHLLTAIFAIGPLVGAATTAARGLRSDNADATDGAARTLTIYAYASVLVVIFGFGLMSAKAPWNESENVAEFSETWIWLSVLLWVVSMALVLGVTVPALKQAATTIRDGQPAQRLAARVAGSGGVVALLFAIVVFLMVYQPGGN